MIQMFFILTLSDPWQPFSGRRLFRACFLLALAFGTRQLQEDGLQAEAHWAQFVQVPPGTFSSLCCTSVCWGAPLVDSISTVTVSAPRRRLVRLATESMATSLP